jgi:hypothetical protein
MQTYIFFYIIFNEHIILSMTLPVFFEIVIIILLLCVMLYIYILGWMDTSYDECLL